MDYLFLRRHRRTATSNRQKSLLLKAAERQWELQFANKGTEGRKVDCALYKCILYNLEIKQVFFGFGAFFEKVQRYDRHQPNLPVECGKQVFQLQFEGVAEYLPCGICQRVTPCWGNVHQKNSHSDVALPLEVLFMPLLVKQSECLLCAFQLENRIIRSQNQ